MEQKLSERRDRSLNTLNNYLKTRTFFVTERITVADVHIATALINPFKNVLDAEKRAQYPHLVRHFETIVNHPKLKAIVGDIEYCVKPLQYTPPAKPKKEEKPKEDKPKEEKPKEAPKPKAEKPKKPATDEEEDDDILKEEPKPKNPLDDLPKSAFNLEDFKRAYSNMDTRGDNGSLKWFYEKCVSV
jgi:elongation factor 1-gamma